MFSYRKVFLISLFLFSSSLHAGNQTYVSVVHAATESYSARASLLTRDTGTDHLVTVSAKSTDAWLESFSQTGRRRWAERVERKIDTNSFLSVFENKGGDSRYLVVGNSVDVDGNSRAWMQLRNDGGGKIDHVNNGDMLSRKEFEKSRLTSLKLRDVRKSGAQTLSLSGSVKTETGENQAWIAQADLNGTLTWQARFTRWELGAPTVLAFVRNGNRATAIVNFSGRDQRSAVLRLRLDDSGQATVVSETLLIERRFRSVESQTALTTLDAIYVAVRWWSVGPNSSWINHTTIVELDDHGVETRRLELPNAPSISRILPRSGGLLLAGGCQGQGCAMRLSTTDRELDLVRTRTFPIGGYAGGGLLLDAVAFNQDYFLVGGIASDGAWTASNSNALTFFRVNRNLDQPQEDDDL